MFFDENLSSRLIALLATSYPQSTHVDLVGLTGAPDAARWDHARSHDLVLVTKDEDFHRLSVFRGFPPKVIWIRIGNCPTGDIASLLQRSVRDVVAFVEHDEAGFLALG